MQAVEIRRLSGRDGLQDMIVSSIYKDTKGYVWLGTASSVERFDGVHFRHFPFPGKEEKPKWVNTIAEVSKGRIYIGNDMGLWTVNNDRLERVLPKKITRSVRAIVYDGRGTVYAGGDAGLCVIRDEKAEAIQLDNNVLSPLNKILAMNLQDNRILWMMTEQKLYSINLTDRKITGHDNVLKHVDHDLTYNKCMTRIGNVLYLGTIKSGIIRYDIKKGRFSRYMDIDGNTITSISSDGHDLLYVSTDGGGVRFISTKTNSVIKSFVYSTDDANTISSNAVYSLLVDRDRLVWIGTFQLGLNYTVWQGNRFGVYSTPFFNSFDTPVRTMLITDSGKVIGTRNGIFFVDEQSKRVLKFQVPVLRSNSVTCMNSSDGKVYAGTFGGGMYEINLAKGMIKDFHPELGRPFTDGFITCIKTDYNGRLWVGSTSGLYRFSNGRLDRHYGNENSQMPGNIVHEIFFDSSGKGWICTDNGLCVYEPSSDRIRADVFPEGFPSKEKVCMIYEDSAHRLYLLPFKGPIITTNLSMTDFGRFNAGSLLEGKDARFIIEDSRKQLWIGTDNGLFRYDRDGTLIPYGFADGLPSPVFLSCTPVQDNNGTLWFGNTKGLIHYNPADKVNVPKYNLAITAFSVNGVSADDKIEKKDEKTYEINLDSEQRNITIGISDFRYTDPAYMTFEYKLEGIDKGWRYLNGKSDVEYYNLHSGTYTFKVRHIGRPESEITMSVHIASSMTMITAITILCIVAFAAGCYFYSKRRKTTTGESDVKVTNNGIIEKGNTEDVTGHAEHADEKYKSGKVPDSECEVLAEKVRRLMAKDRLYTNQNLKISDLANAAGTTPNVLSYMFNQYLNQNYYDFINNYRIAEFKRVVAAGEYERFTLNALMEKCGFSSRTSFFRCFKKQCGLTPTEYIRKQAET